MMIIENKSLRIKGNPLSDVLCLWFLVYGCFWGTTKMPGLARKVCLTSRKQLCNRGASGVQIKKCARKRLFRSLTPPALDDGNAGFVRQAQCNKGQRSL